jgi:hypothetical protein
MPLPEFDEGFLKRRGFDYDVVEEASMSCLVLKGWLLPPGLSVDSADLLIRIQAGYPDLAPDMWWFAPAITLANGGVIPATEVIEMHLGRSWQRWSRHFDVGQWRSGVDGLESYVALIEREVARAAEMSAA